MFDEDYKKLYKASIKYIGEYDIEFGRINIGDHEILIQMGKPFSVVTTITTNERDIIKVTKRFDSVL